MRLSYYPKEGGDMFCIFIFMNAVKREFLNEYCFHTHRQEGDEDGRQIAL